VSCEIPDVSAKHKKKTIKEQNRTMLQQFLLRKGIFKPQKYRKNEV